ncbi:MAG: MATE family efflux transporter [Clostridia bacterium]|nr:MATE family efflux transporter [Clostridia bacterium]
MKKSIEEYVETMDIKKAAWEISIPMVISMISLALYGIVDTIFVSNLGESALNAISLSYPIQNIITALGLGIAIGLNVVLSKSIGEKNKEKSNKIIVNGIILSALAWIIVAVLALFGTESFLKFFTKDTELINLGVVYLKITSVLSVGILFEILFEKVLEAYGKTKESMILQMSGAIINLVLDPILIYGFLGAPKLGIQGAAIATVIGQISGMLIGIFLILKNKIVNTSIFKQMKADFETMKSILYVGIPTMLMEALSSFIILLLNKILIGISETAVSVWGIYVKVEKFVFIIIHGFDYGMMPMLGYSIGAKKQDKIKDIIHYFYKLALAISIIGMLLFMLLPKVMIGWFGVSNETLQIGIVAFRILAIGFIFQATSTVLSAVFQSFEKASYSLIISLLRKIVIAIPIILIFKDSFGLNVVWWAYSIAEIITAIVAIVLYKKSISKQISVKPL